MTSLAFNIFGSSRPHRADPPLYVPGAAGLLKGMSREIPLKWALLDGLARELAKIGGLVAPQLRPEEQFFPISAELAGGSERAVIVAELDDMIAMAAPAVEVLGKARHNDQIAVKQAASLFEGIVAARTALRQILPPEAA